MTASGMVILSGHTGAGRRSISPDTTIPTEAMPPDRPPGRQRGQDRDEREDQGGGRQGSPPGNAAGSGPARRGAATGGNRWSREGIPLGHPGSPACSLRKLRPPMNQARNDDGSYGDGWYHDDQQLPPSLGVWPLGRTYVHSSDGALNTGPAVAGDPGANGHGGAERSFDGDHIAAPRFSGAAGDGSTPLYERLALYERLSASPPADPGPSRNDRPPLYQVGGKYRGDDWPTDPGFRRGDLDLEDFPADPAPDRGRPDPGYDPGRGAGPGPQLRRARAGQVAAARPAAGHPDPARHARRPGAGAAGRRDLGAQRDAGRSR